VSDSAIVTFALIAAVTGIAYGLYLAMWVFKLNAGNAKMQEIAKAIQEGAGAYMNRQYRTVGVVAAVLFAILWAGGLASDKFGLLTAVGFLIGLERRFEVLDAFDHKNLNEDLPVFRERVPTTENLCMEIFDRLRRFSGARLVRIRLGHLPRES